MKKEKTISDVRISQKRTSRILGTIIGALLVSFFGVVIYLFVLIKQFEKSNTIANDHLTEKSK